MITSFNSRAVFVRYGADVGSKATSRQDLEWVGKPTFAGSQAFSDQLADSFGAGWDAVCPSVVVDLGDQAWGHRD